MLQAEMTDRIRALAQISGVGLRIINADGSALERTEPICEACAFFQMNFSSSHACRELGKMAASRARDIGETYVYCCPLGLYNAVHALKDGTGADAILAGPFLLEELDTIFLHELSERFPVPIQQLLDIYDRVQNVKVLPPARATALSKLMNHLFENEGGADAQHRRMQLQQRRIGESIQAYKDFSGGAPSYPYEKEQDLIQYVEAGNIGDANRVLNDLLGYALFSTGGDIETIKNWAAALCALLSRAASHNGKGDGFHMDHSFMRSLWDAPSQEKLALLLQEIVERFCQSVFPHTVRGEKSAVTRAMRYVESHFDERITLDMVAQHVYLSPSYLSSLFKKTLGLPFNKYLNSVRIEEAKRRFRQKQNNITEVAYAVGYESQSYFSKVFRLFVDMSPSDYLNMQLQAHDEQA